MYRIKNKIYAYINVGALGDVVNSFPILLELFKNKHLEKIILNPRFMDLFSLFFPKSLLFNGDDKRKTIDKDGKEIEVLNFEASATSYIMFLSQEDRSHITSLGIHLTDIASLNLAGKILKAEDKYLPLIERGKKIIDSDNYIVLCSGYTNEIRKMRDDSFLAIKNYLISQGYDVVLLGTSKHLLTYSTGQEVNPRFVGDRDGCIDMIDKTNLIEALEIINHSRGVIGLDNGLIHLSSLTDVDIVVGYTNCSPEFRNPFRKKGMTFNVVPPNKICRFCQTDNYCTFNEDWSKCPNKTLDCAKSLTPDVWLSVIKPVFNNKAKVIV